MDIASQDRKQVGALGEKIAAEYARRRGMRIVARNVARKTGEIDIIAKKGETLHFIEVKTLVVTNLPEERQTDDRYDPSANIHEAKIRRIARTAEWYVANIDWDGEWQVDAALVWIRKGDGKAKVTYLPQIL